MLKSQFEKAIEAFDKIVENTREIIRPGRSFEKKQTAQEALLNELQTIMKYY